MPPAVSSLAPPPGCVLELSATRAEWLAADAELDVGCELVHERSVRALAQAAVAARGAHSGRAKECTLALGAGLVVVRLLRLPQLKRAELALVLERKAAAWLDAPAGDVLYQAAEMGAGDAELDGEPRGEQTWLVTAARRSELVALRRQLQRAGFAPRRIVAARLAALDCARAALPAPELAAIAVLFAPTGISVALLRGAELVHLDELEGDFSSSPALAATLLQTVRTTAGYWRKLSRGSTLDQVAVIGLAGERATLLGHALEASLPGVRVCMLPGASEPVRAPSSAGRRAALACARVAGPFAQPLAVRVPVPRSVMASAIGASVLLVAGAGLVARQARMRTLSELAGQTERMRQRAATLDALSERHGVERTRIDRVEARAARLLEVGCAGLSHEAVLEDVLHALDGRATLAALDLRMQGPRSAVVRVEAAAAHEPAAFARAVSALRGELSARPGWSGVELALPADLTSQQPGEPLRFALDAEVATLR